MSCDIEFMLRDLRLRHLYLTKELTRTESIPNKTLALENKIIEYKEALQRIESEIKGLKGE